MTEPNTTTALAIPTDQIAQAYEIITKHLPTIVTPEQAQYAADNLARFRATVAAYETMRRAETDPLMDQVTSIRARYKPHEEFAAAGAKYLSALLSEYHLTAQQARREVFAQAADAAELGDHTTSRALVAQSNALAEVSVPKGAAVVTSWTAEVVDANAVPRQWCEPAEKKINAYARAHKGDSPPPPIDGVRFVQVASTRRVGRKK